MTTTTIWLSNPVGGSRTASSVQLRRMVRQTPGSPTETAMICVQEVPASQDYLADGERSIWLLEEVPEGQTRKTVPFLYESFHLSLLPILPTSASPIHRVPMYLSLCHSSRRLKPSRGRRSAVKHEGLDLLFRTCRPVFGLTD